MNYQINLDCPLCKIYVILPIKQFKSKDGGMFLNNLKCVNCQTVLTPSLEVEK